MPDVAVIGAGPVGCVTALAFARRGAQVLLLEIRPEAPRRLGGEWLHPGAVAVLQRLGVMPALASVDSSVGQGFAVYPDDGTSPILMRYPAGMSGMSCEYSGLLTVLRDAVAAQPSIRYLSSSKVTNVEGQTLSFMEGASSRTIRVPAIVGTTGRSPLTRKWLGLPDDRAVVSHMAGVLLEDVDAPFEGFGHLFIGVCGPGFLYRIGPKQLRLMLDAPALPGTPKAGAAMLWDSYGRVLPPALRPAFYRSLQERTPIWAANTVSPRAHYGREGFALAGDAAGHCHPITAVGLTLGFMDGESLAASDSFARYRRERASRSRAPRLLAGMLHELLTLERQSAAPLRQAVYRLWRNDLKNDSRAMSLLAGEDGGRWEIVRPLVQVVAAASLTMLQRGYRWRSVTDSLQYLRRSLTQLALGKWFPAAKAADVSASIPPRVDVSAALERGTRFLLSSQGTDGSWEGEVVWCPMLAAQYVLTAHVIGLAISQERREALLRHFATTSRDGLWSLGAQAAPSLYMTTLVYIAARLLGVASEDPLIAAAHRFILENGGVVAIPTWGKFWLAVLNLYDWDGVQPILPEAWKMPRWLPFHPSNFYCHTRMIYLGMAYLYGRKFQAPLTDVLQAVRAELYAADYSSVDFRRARGALRSAEIFSPPSLALRCLYGLSAAYERWHLRSLRQEVLAELLGHIRMELRNTDYACLSPVNGLLNILSLWLADPNDGDLRKALARFGVWMFEDRPHGLRVAGALSATWDTAFALQALEAAARPEAAEGLRQGRLWLASQQMTASLPGRPEETRGGFCFARVWHGWPVSDCTAEALLALQDDADSLSPRRAQEAVRFILGCQNPDGGFGSYERRRTASTLSWMNSAEMFGDSMTEHSYVECTASCVAALSRFSPISGRQDVGRAVDSAGVWLRRQQREDGSWPGAWGIYFIYGTLFGIRGLLAAGVPGRDPAIRKACRWLLKTQRPDGGWGEYFESSLRDVYIEHPQSQAVQTAWALLALLEAGETDEEAIARGAQCLARLQGEDGNWPKQDPSGIFFRTASLDYTLYRSYFPVWALGLYEARRRLRPEAPIEPARSISLETPVAAEQGAAS